MERRPRPHSEWPAGVANHRWDLDIPEPIPSCAPDLLSLDFRIAGFGDSLRVPTPNVSD